MKTNSILKNKHRVLHTQFKPDSCGIKIWRCIGSAMQRSPNFFQSRLTTNILSSITEALNATSEHSKDGSSVLCCCIRVDAHPKNCVVHCVLCRIKCIISDMSCRSRVSTRCWPWEKADGLYTESDLQRDNLPVYQILLSFLE